jgi:uracil-DNA glycosylase
VRSGTAPDGAELRTATDAMRRAASLDLPHVAEIEGYRRTMEARFGATPHADPADGGVDAELLILLETPGPRGRAPRFVSCDNPTGTARNLRRFLAQAGIDRRAIVLWNVVPWLIHAPGARNRAPREREIAAGLAELPGFLRLLPGLRGVVAAGRVAARATPVLQQARPGVPVLAMPHPSPTFVCTSPAVPARILAALEDAAALLDAPQPPLSTGMAREIC